MIHSLKRISELPQEMLDEAMSHTELTIVPVQKPGDQEFIRVHPSADYRHIAAIIEYSEEKGAEYLIHPTCIGQIKEFGIKFHLKQLYLYITKQGTFSGGGSSCRGMVGKIRGWIRQGTQQKKRSTNG